MGVYVPPPGCALEEWFPLRNCTISVHSKSFRIRTYAPPRKCSLYRTYGNAKSFRIRTYKKHGGRALPGNGPVTNRQSLGTRAGGRNPAEFRPPKAGALSFSGVSDQKGFAQQDVRTRRRNVCRQGPVRGTPHSQDIAAHRRAHSTRDHRFPTTGPARRIFRANFSGAKVASPSK